MKERQTGIHSTGNQRFGVVMHVMRRATRLSSKTNRACSARLPTCSITALECTTLNEPSADGNALPLANTKRTPGYCCSRKLASSSPAAVNIFLCGYDTST